jgi:hypothetical protein
MLTFFIEKDSFRTESRKKFHGYIPESKNVALATRKNVVFPQIFRLKSRHEKIEEVRARAAPQLHFKHHWEKDFFWVPEQFFVMHRDNYQT